ncbi:uncharacterized protein F5147DRAFT_581885 [Suillus discolor]|uniref:Uncharacterized protein n=1 Tax=Suillus discolor TaxID=1912936 RepID=A0A9P7F1I1_9AGAM|nr:uncharacterized protein F5147DRAFT_581885 [Suillus discolor]KAG2101094.1 hypothetical protein F5147DRAFT_581885 [Suillus discolor]
MLSITCDNVSNNDRIICKLSDKVLGFSGAVMYTRCFLHMVNLVVKLLINEFNVKKQGAN